MPEDLHQSGARRNAVSTRLGDWAGAFTLLIMIVLFVGALVHELVHMKGLLIINTGQWGMADSSYLIGLALLAVATLCHAMVISPTRSPVTAIWLSVGFGAPGVLLALGLAGLLMIGSDTNWKVARTFSSFVLNILPFVMVFAAGIVMLRMRDRPIRLRVIGVGICVAAAAVVVALAACIPRLVRAAELGTL